MISGLAWMVVANAALLLASHALLRRVRTENGAVNALLFVLIHLLLVSVSVLVAGLTGFLTPRALGLSGAVLLGLLLLLREYRFLRLPAKPDVGRATAVLAGAIALRMLLQVWFLAPTDADVVSYHLPKIAEWVLAGSFTREMGSDYCAPFAAGFELIEMWWVVFLHHDVLIEMGGVEFAVAAFLAVRLLALRLGLSERASYLASTLYVLTPAFNMQSTSCLNDAPVAALVLSLAALVFAQAHPALLLIPLGLVTGIKATGIYTLPGWALLWLWLWRRKEPVARPASLGAAIPLGAAALAVGAFWYLRNYLWYGSPVFPVKTGPLTYYEMLRCPIQIGPSLTSLHDNLGELVTGMVYDHRSVFTAICFKTAGWGIVAFSIGILASFHQVRTDRTFRMVAAAFLLSLLTVLLMVRTDVWFSRFLLFFPAILSIAAARAAESTRPVALLLVAGIAIQFAGTLFPQARPPAQYLAMMRQPWRERSADAMYDMIPPGLPIGVHAMLRAPTYLFYGPDYSRRVVYLRPPSVQELPAEMERQGIRYAYIHVFLRATFDLQDLVRQGRLRQVREKFYEVR